MQRSDRKRTTLTPGVVDLPRSRRTPAQVALEKKKKSDAAAAKTEAKRLAAAQVAELERGIVATQNEGSSINIPVPKRPRKRPETSTNKNTPEAPRSSEPTVAPAKTLLNKHGKKRKADEQPVAAVAKKKGGPRSSAPAKPKGFKNHLTHGLTAPRPPSEEPEVATDGENSDGSEGDGEDELEFPGSDDSLSMVTITPSPVNDQTSDRQTSRLGVHSLPEVIRRSFANTFIPCVVSKVGCSSAPWRRVEAGVLQNLFTLVYPNHDLTITKGDALESTTNSRIMSFRNAVAKRAQENVQAYMERFDVHDTEAYVASAFSYHKEIPFLYRVFRPTDIVEPDPKKELGGFKVTRHGLFRHQVILQTMLIYYQQIKSDVETACLTGIHPVGMLALVCAAVARALRMHKTGVFVPDSTPFSEKDFGKDTLIYLKLIKELSESRWAAFYSALKVTAEILAELQKISKWNSEPALQDEPEGYHIRDSDPIDPDEVVDADVE